MTNNKNSKKSLLGVVPAIARKLGERTVSSTCVLWFNQPVVPASMKKEQK